MYSHITLNGAPATARTTAAKLIYTGTADRAIKPLRRLRPVLEGIGCTYLEFDNLNHQAADLATPAHHEVTNTITTWLDQEQVFCQKPDSTRQR